MSLWLDARWWVLVRRGVRLPSGRALVRCIEPFRRTACRLAPSGYRSLTPTRPSLCFGRCALVACNGAALLLGTLAARRCGSPAGLGKPVFSPVLPEFVALSVNLMSVRCTGRPGCARPSRVKRLRAPCSPVRCSLRCAPRAASARALDLHPLVHGL